MWEFRGFYDVWLFWFSMSFSVLFLKLPIGICLLLVANVAAFFPGDSRPMLLITSLKRLFCIERSHTLYFCSSFCHIIRSHKTKHQMHQKRLSKKVFDTFSAFIYKYFYKVRILFFCFISVPMAGFWSQLQSPDSPGPHPS